MDKPVTRIHLAIGVSSMEASLAFYKKFFQCEPSRITEDQIDWILDEPPINFSIFYNPDRPIGIEHFGLDLPSSQLEEYIERLSVPLDDMAIYDPDEVRVEIFSSGR